MEKYWVPRSILLKKMKEDVKRAENSVKCKCGHRVFLGSKEKEICSWCNKYVFKNEKDEFLYRFEEAKRREKK